MVRGTDTKGLVLLVVVFWAACVSAAPTLNVHGNPADRCDSEVPSPVTVVYSPDISEVLGLAESYLAVVGPEFHKPTVRYSGQTAQAKSIKSLPPAPSTFVLALLGFLLVTSVKDRSLWFAGIVSVLCAGQSGFALLPQLASHLDLRGRYSSSSFHASGSAILRFSAAPRDTESSASLDPIVLRAASYGGTCARRFAGVLMSGPCGRGGGDHAPGKRKVIQAAISIGLCCLDSGSIGRVRQARQFLFHSRYGLNFTPARGPPR